MADLAQRAEATGHQLRRRPGAPVIPHGRGELLALVYGIGGIGAAVAWAVDPGDFRQPLGMGLLLALVALVAGLAFGLRRRLPAGSEDVGVVASLVLISVAVALTRYRVHPDLITPYYIWVGFSSPLWFPLRRASLYLVLTLASCGAMMAIAGTAAALATWVTVSATTLVAFIIVLLLARWSIRTERLAAVGQMAGAVGHELRNPLAALTNTLYLLRAQLGPDLRPETDECLAIAERQVARATTLADDLTAFVHPRPPRLQPVALPTVLEEVLDSLRPPAGVDVVRRLRPAVVLADRAQLATLFTNLVVNAYDAVGTQGVVRVELVELPGAVEVAVHDSGHGIDEAMMDRIFEPFATTKTRGTGLGLAIARRIAEDHGGRITCASQPGRGTRMTVRLPAVAP